VPKKFGICYNLKLYKKSKSRKIQTVLCNSYKTKVSILYLRKIQNNLIFLNYFLYIF